MRIPSAMTKQQQHTLRVIAAHCEGLTRSELRSKLGIPRASSNARASRLISAGLVLELDPKDGTSDRLYISDMGKSELADRL